MQRSKMKVIRDFLARQKFTLARGQQYLSLVFWAVTMANVVLLNLQKYFILNFWQYLGLTLVGVVVIVFGVWLVGFIDLRARMYSAESQYSQVLTPIVKDTYENTQKLVEKICPELKVNKGKEGNTMS